MANLSKERVKYNKRHMSKAVKTTESNEDMLSIYGGILMVILPVLLLLISSITSFYKFYGYISGESSVLTAIACGTIITAVAVIAAIKLSNSIFGYFMLIVILAVALQCEGLIEGIYDNISQLTCTMN